MQWCKPLKRYKAHCGIDFWQRLLQDSKPGAIYEDNNQQPYSSYRLARVAGFDNVNLDFIFGLPGQDLAHLDGELDRLLSLESLPDHL